MILEDALQIYQTTRQRTGSEISQQVSSLLQLATSYCWEWGHS